MSRLLSPLLTGLDREHFLVLALDARNRPIGAHTVSVGSLSAAIVHPREVFKFAILANAAAVILAHNHPSGDCAPSRDDVETHEAADGRRQAAGDRRCWITWWSLTEILSASEKKD